MSSFTVCCVRVEPPSTRRPARRSCQSGAHDRERVDARDAGRSARPPPPASPRTSASRQVGRRSMRAAALPVRRRAPRRAARRPGRRPRSRRAAPGRAARRGSGPQRSQPAARQGRRSPAASGASAASASRCPRAFTAAPRRRRAPCGRRPPARTSPRRGWARVRNVPDVVARTTYENACSPSDRRVAKSSTRSSWRSTWSKPPRSQKSQSVASSSCSSCVAARGRRAVVANHDSTGSKPGGQRIRDRDVAALLREAEVERDAHEVARP